MKIEFEIKKKLVIDDELVCNVLDSFDGWWYSISYNSNAYKESRERVEYKQFGSDIVFEDVLLQMLKDKKRIYICDEEDSKKYILTLKKLINGIKKYVSEYNAWDTDDWDACSSDCILQFAVFGDVIYG